MAAFVKLSHRCKIDNIKEDDTIGTARRLMQTNGYKDVFVVERKGDVAGWLTDTRASIYVYQKLAK